jgi:hypothetical protein
MTSGVRQGYKTDRTRGTLEAPAQRLTPEEMHAWVSDQMTAWAADKPRFEEMRQIMGMMATHDAERLDNHQPQDFGVWCASPRTGHRVLDIDRAYELACRVSGTVH